MNICIIGDGLTGLSLAKNLINKKINVHIYCENIPKAGPNSCRIITHLLYPINSYIQIVYFNSTKQLDT